LKEGSNQNKELLATVKKECEVIRSPLLEALANYCRSVMDKILPEETEKKKIKSKVLLEPRSVKPWFQVAGAWVQGEIYSKKKNHFEIHGRAIILFPNLFLIIGTFNHNKIEETSYLCLRNDSSLE
jgi:hypothetical protein